VGAGIKRQKLHRRRSWTMSSRGGEGRSFL
jgi:hypothetical protein